MAKSELRLKINPGGALRPGEVIGRDAFVESIWETLESQSVLLTAERRMGKTSVLLKLEAAPRPSSCVIRQTLEGIRSPEEFVAKFLNAIETACPGLLKRTIWERVSAAGIRSVGTGPLSIEFAPVSEGSWKEVLDQTFAALDQEVDEQIILLLDELPHMISDIEHDQGAAQARQMLDLLRAARESHASIRMVLSGSLGIHHVVSALQGEGGMWMPTHDTHAEDLPPLAKTDAAYLARELLLNEEIACDNIDLVASQIALEADLIPFYIHHTAYALRARQRTGEVDVVDVTAVAEAVQVAIESPRDPWQLGHYVQRTKVYYGEGEEVVNTILDIVAAAKQPLASEEIYRLLASQLKPPSEQYTNNLLDLLCRDYYLARGSTGYVFLRNLVRRAWQWRRPPR